MRPWYLRPVLNFIRLALNTIHVLAVTAAATFKFRAALQLENLALLHKPRVLQ
jgi:hypothetical protein